MSAVLAQRWRQRANMSIIGPVSSDRKVKKDRRRSDKNLFDALSF